MEDFFESRPTPQRHFFKWYELALRANIQPVIPVDQFRYLDVGCSTGRSLLPIACSFPNARFVGVDLDEQAIELARKHAKALNLENVEFFCMDARGMQREQFPEFHYICMHGLFSWCSKLQAAELLQTMRSLLSSKTAGILMISLHMLPGAAQKVALREQIIRVTTDESSQEGKATKARDYLEKLLPQFLQRTDPYALSMAYEIDQALKRDLVAFSHDYLVNEFHAYTLEELLTCAREAKLDCFASVNSKKSATESSSVFLNDEEFSRTLFELGDSLQHLLLTPTQTRREDNLWTKKSATLFYSTSLVPESEKPDVYSVSEITFCSPSGSHIQLSLPIEKSAIVTLCGVWPEFMSLEELSQLSIQLCDSDMNIVEVKTVLDNLLTSLSKQGLVAVAPQALPLARHSGTYPKTFEWVLLESKTSNWVTTGRYEFFPLSAFDKSLLPLLDGEHSLEKIEQILSALVLSGGLGVRQDGEQVLEKAQIRAIILESLKESLRRYAEHGLLQSS